MVSAHPADDPGGARRVGSDLPLRVISSVALAPLALGAAWLGGWVFLLLWLAAALIVLWEWNALAAGEAARRATIGGGGALVAAAAAVAWQRPDLAAVAFVTGVTFVTVATRRPWPALGFFCAACIVIPAILLRADAAYGLVAIILLFAVVWGTDIAAYFGGRLIGGPKLLPSVSPKKTWSGAIVGAALGTAAGAGVAWAGGVPNLTAVAAVCLMLSIASQAGDLFESAVKRRFGVKDAGKLIPGHGGLMDRLDGFAGAALTAVVIGVWRAGITAPARGFLIW
jgi:phosphatidate cytidylyltransferase